MSAMHRVAVIGAGLSGLCAARHLQASSLPLSITIFEKSRSLGGRLATKTDFSPTALDHGAPFFTLSTSARDFLSHLLPAETINALPSDAIQNAQGEIIPGQTRLYCPAGNAAIGSVLAQGLSITRSTATTVSPNGLISLLPYKENEAFEQGPFDLIVVAIPLPQAANILSLPPHIGAQWQSTYTPTLTALLTYDLNHVPDVSPLHRAVAGKSPYAIEEGGILTACETYKRGKGDGVAVLIAHADDAFSERHLEDEGDVWLPMVRETAEAAWGIPSEARIDSFAKRWRYARVRDGWKGAESVCAWMNGRVLLTGDGVCGESDVSKVIEHGLDIGRMAERILNKDAQAMSGS